MEYSWGFFGEGAPSSQWGCRKRRCSDFTFGNFRY